MIDDVTHRDAYKRLKAYCQSRGIGFAIVKELSIDCGYNKVLTRNTAEQLNNIYWLLRAKNKSKMKKGRKV